MKPYSMMRHIAFYHQAKNYETLNDWFPIKCPKAQILILNPLNPMVNIFFQSLALFLFTMSIEDPTLKTSNFMQSFKK